MNSYKVLIYVADDLRQIDDEMSRTIGSAWSRSTLQCRNSQWSRYIKFTRDHGLQTMPGSPQTVARFIIWQSRSSKYSTCNNYLSAINVLHKFYGFDVDFRDSFLMKLVMKGLKSTLGDKAVQNMYSKLDLQSEQETICWTVMILWFRSLLRKSNLVPNTLSDFTHVLRRRDISFHDWGLMVRVVSTKTLQHLEYELEIPVYYVDEPALCVASAVKYLICRYPASDDSPLFFVPTSKGLLPLLYSSVLAHVKLCANRIGMKPEQVGCHSLRRSGAAHVHSIGIPLIDIMSIGDWKSLAVLDYLVTPSGRKSEIQKSVAASFAKIG